MPLRFGGKLIFDDVAGKSTARTQCADGNGKLDQLLFEYIIESALFYNLCCNSSERHVKQLLGILLIRICRISSTVGTELARRAAEQFIALGSHISDNPEDGLCSLWSVAQHIYQEVRLLSLPASPRPIVETPFFLLKSPVLDFLNELLDTIALKAGNDAVKLSLEALNYLRELTGSSKRLYFWALLSNKTRIVSSLLQFASDVDANAHVSGVQQIF